MCQHEYDSHENSTFSLSVHKYAEDYDTFAYISRVEVKKTGRELQGIAVLRRNSFLPANVGEF